MAGQYVAYTFFKVDPAWRRLPIDERRAGKDAFAEVVEDWTGRMASLRAYSTGGVRPDADFFLWKITERYEDLGELGAALNSTPLAGWLSTPTRTSPPGVGYEGSQAAAGKSKGSPYLVVYPFVKVRGTHFRTRTASARWTSTCASGRLSTITNHTTYSFGIDDQSS